MSPRRRTVENGPAILSLGIGPIETKSGSADGRKWGVALTAIVQPSD
jgi:hypothetical protein